MATKNFFSDLKEHSKLLIKFFNTFLVSSFVLKRLDLKLPDLMLTYCHDITTGYNSIIIPGSALVERAV